MKNKYLVCGRIHIQLKTNKIFFYFFIIVIESLHNKCKPQNDTDKKLAAYSTNTVGKQIVHYPEAIIMNL